MPAPLVSHDFEQILSSSPNAIIVRDADDRARPILYANRAFCELTGYSLEEVLGQGIAFLQRHVALPDNASALSEVQEAIATGRPARVVLQCARKDGSIFWNEVSLYSVHHAPSGRHLVVKSLRDVTARVELEQEFRASDQAHRRRAALKTADVRKALEQLYDEVIERKLAEQDLRATEQKYRSVVENAVEGIYRSTPDGKYLDANPALARMYGFSSPQEMLADVASIEREIYVDPAMRRQFRSLIERDGVVRNLEYEVRRRDGSTIWICENARAILGRGGRVIAYEGMIQDISERRSAQAAAGRLERQLLQAHKLEALGTLAGGIAHDFNNILGAIIGFAEMSRDDTRDRGISPENIDQVIAAARRGKELIRQILVFSRADANQRRTIAVRPIITEVVRFLAVAVPATITIEHDSGEHDASVLADAIQIQQVLLNLGTNAVHAMKAHGGVLRFGFRVVDLPAADDELTPGRYVRIHVSDTGHGMTPEVMRRIFEPFFTTKPVGEGTGLGLSVAHSIVQAHGGALRVTSESGRGTEFAVLIPAASAPAARITHAGDENATQVGARGALARSFKNAPPP